MRELCAMIRQLDDRTMISGQIAPGDLADLGRHGVTMVVNNRPNFEDPDQPMAADIEKAAEEAGIAYRFVPIIRGIGPSDIECMQEAIDGAGEGKMLAFCRSGTRSALTWALARRGQGASREEVVERLASAGVDVSPIAHLL